MEQDRTWDEKLIRILPAFILVYCLLQPVLDVLGYWQQIWEQSNVLTSAIRVVLLVASVLLGFLLSDRKRYYFLLAGVLALLGGLHVAANLQGTYLSPMTDLANLARIFVLPVTVCCFITFLRRGGARVFRAVKLGMAADLICILLVELISVATGTDRGTYVKEQIGVIGWFIWGNCQSAILSMLTPLVICWTLDRWKDRLLPVALVTLAAEAALFFFGTRLAFLSMIASGFGISVCMLILARRRWKQILIIVLITGLLTCAYPISPAARRVSSLSDSNLQNEQTFQGVQESIPSEAPAVVSGEEDEFENLETVYRYYFWAVVDRFGIERVAEKYNYTLDAAVLGNIRTCKRYVCEMIMEDAPSMCSVFGLNVNEYVIHVRGDEGRADYDVSFEVENDFYGIYFVLGIAGFVLITGFLLYFGLRALICVIRNRKVYFTIQMAGFAGAYVIAMVHALFTTSVLRRNNASVYLALVLVGIWYLSRKNESKEAVPSRSPESALPERMIHGKE